MREFLKLPSTELAIQSVSVGVGLKSAPILISSNSCDLSDVEPKGQRSSELVRNSVVDSKSEPDGKTALSNASFNEKDQATIAKYIERIKNDLTQALKELQAPVEFNKGIFFNRSLSLVALNDESKAILSEFSKIFEGDDGNVKSLEQFFDKVKSFHGYLNLEVSEIFVKKQDHYRKHLSFEGEDNLIQKIQYPDEYFKSLKISSLLTSSSSNIESFSLFEDILQDHVILLLKDSDIKRLVSMFTYIYQMDDGLLLDLFSNTFKLERFKLQFFVVFDSSNVSLDVLKLKDFKRILMNF